MAKIINGEFYLSPMEASRELNVSYKTLERWAENGIRSAWENGESGRRREQKDIKVEYIKTPTGYRYYKLQSIQELSKQLRKY
jgi:DNA-binding transcriptional MerR regulator